MARRSILEDHLDIVGILPDQEVALKFGMTAENIRAWRKRRGIPAQWRNEGGAAPSAPAAAASGDSAAPAKAKARKSKSSKPRATRGSAIERFEHLLGIVSDATVAGLSGRKVRSVSAHRRKLGIQPAPASENEHTPPRHRKSKLDPFRHLLGKVADSEVAEQAGVTEGNVSNFRRRHRIPTTAVVARLIAERSQPEPEPEDAAQEAAAPAAAPAAAAQVREPVARRGDRPGAVEWAYMVTVDVDGEERPYTIVGRDLAHAAATAAERLRVSRPGAVLMAMERVAEVV